METKKEVYTGFQAEKFLSKYIKVSQSQLVKAIKEITISPPAVLKLISPDVIHKTEMKAIRIANDKESMQKEFNNLVRLAKTRNLRLEGIMAQKFYEGEQLIIGIKKDSVFGHVILFGMGGIFTEVLEDIAIRKCPITEVDALEMIDELKAKKIFYGFRGKKLNINVLKETLIKVSQIPLKHTTIEELDINPFILNESEGVVVDARIVFRK